MAASVFKPPSPARAEIARPSSNWFEQFLQKTGTEKYRQIFINEECTDATTLKLFTDNDFEQLGIKKGARIRILEYLNMSTQPRTGYHQPPPSYQPPPNYQDPYYQEPNYQQHSYQQSTFQPQHDYQQQQQGNGRPLW